MLYFRFSSLGQLSVEKRDIVMAFFPLVQLPRTCLGNYTPCAGGHDPAIVVQSADRNRMCQVFIMTSSKKFPGATYVKLNIRSKLKKRSYMQKYKFLRGNVLPTICWLPCQYISVFIGVLGKVPKDIFKNLIDKVKFDTDCY